jgi:hypothetical protein
MIYGYVESPKTENSEFETSDFSENATEISDKEISTAKENEDILQLEIPLESEE